MRGLMDTGGALFAGAIVVLFLAHVVRAMRHTLLFREGEVPERFHLLLALSLAYAVDSVVPLRLGEVLRALFIAVRMRMRFPYVVATVVAERFSDLLVVAGLVSVLAPAAGASPWVGLVLGTGALAMLAFVALVRRSARARRVVWRVASIFNESIRDGLLDFMWSTSQLVREGQLLTPRYLCTTAGMWTLYLAAYAMFGAAVGLTLPAVSLDLLSAPLRSLPGGFWSVGASSYSLEYLVFTAVPVVAVLGYGLLRQQREIGRALVLARRFGLAPVPMEARLVSHRFRQGSDYAAFLRAKFSATHELVTTFVGDGVSDALVHRLLPGGSDAITAIVEVHGALTIRKFAIGAAGEKLRVQAEWLRAQQQILPLTPILSERSRPGCFLYDMPYMLTASDFYDVIHTAPVRTSMALLRDVVENVDCFHQRNARERASNATVDAYLEQKVIANARQILSYARAAVPSEYTINGEPHLLGEWEHLLDLDWLRAQIRHRETSVVHGDLTIENIIVCPDVPKGWYIIDPNPENVLDTPLIDWAKLMQSLHLGYEGLNRGTVAQVRGEALHVAFTRSNAYVQLHALLSHVLHTRLGGDVMREIAFHELVNYLRLTPYKLRHAPQKGLTFFACTSVLLHRYRSATRA